jgi:hypothetical protein
MSAAPGRATAGERKASYKIIERTIVQQPRSAQRAHVIAHERRLSPLNGSRKQLAIYDRPTAAERDPRYEWPHCADRQRKYTRLGHSATAERSAAA